MYFSGRGIHESILRICFHSFQDDHLLGTSLWRIHRSSFRFLCWRQSLKVNRQVFTSVYNKNYMTVAMNIIIVFHLDTKRIYIKTVVVEWKCHGQTVNPSVECADTHTVEWRSLLFLLQLFFQLFVVTVFIFWWLEEKQKYKCLILIISFLPSFLFYFWYWKPLHSRVNESLFFYTALFGFLKSTLAPSLMRSCCLALSLLSRWTSLSMANFKTSNVVFSTSNSSTSPSTWKQKLKFMATTAAMDYTLILAKRPKSERERSWATMVLLRVNKTFK